MGSSVVKTGLLFLLFLTISFNLTAQSYSWGRTPGGIGNDAATDVVVDTEGYIYLTGNIAGTAEFNGTNYSHYELYESFLSKYDSQGNLIWVELGGGHGVDKANAICLDKNNNILITGYFEDTAWFGNQFVVSKGDKDVFVVKYNSSGNVLNLWSFGGIETDIPNGITTDDNNNIYIVGNFEDNILIGNQNFSTTNFFNETFIASFSQIGIYRWALVSSGSAYNQASSVDYNNLGKIGIVGYWGGDFSILNNTISSTGTSYDVYTLCLDTLGVFQWLLKDGGSYEDAGNEISADNNGNFFTAGYFSGIANFGNNTLNYYDYNDVFIQKINSFGNREWVKRVGGYKLDFVGGLNTDNNGNVYATGFYEENAEFGNTWYSAIDRDCYVVSFSGNGNFRWVTTGGGVQADVGLAVYPENSETIYIAGYYLHTATFGTVALDYADNNDALLLKFNAPTVNISESIFQNKKSKVFFHDSKIFIQNKSIETYTCSLKNFSGQEIFNSKNNNKMDVSALSKGIYFLTIEYSEDYTNEAFKIVIY